HLLAAGGEKLDVAVDRLLETLGRGPFIFNLGHGILLDTPPENVERVVDRVKSWSAS
ncbi:MAG: uroporphyrinogen decarboxylase family protein, partial [Rhodospirillales bacterium]